MELWTLLLFLGAALPVSAQTDPGTAERATANLERLLTRGAVKFWDGEKEFKIIRVIRGRTNCSLVIEGEASDGTRQARGFAWGRTPNAYSRFDWARVSDVVDIRGDLIGGDGKVKSGEELGVDRESFGDQIAESMSSLIEVCDPTREPSRQTADGARRFISTVIDRHTSKLLIPGNPNVYTPLTSAESTGCTTRLHFKNPAGVGYYVEIDWSTATGVEYFFGRVTIRGPVRWSVGVNGTNLDLSTEGAMSQRLSDAMSFLGRACNVENPDGF